MASPAERADDDVAQRGQVRGRVSGTGLARVLTKRDITHVVALVLHRPVVPGVSGQVSRSRLARRQRRDAEDDLLSLPSRRLGRLAAADDLEHLSGVREVDALGAGHPDLAGLATAMPDGGLAEVLASVLEQAVRLGEPGRHG